MLAALLPSHEMCWKLHPFGNRWHLRERVWDLCQIQAKKANFMELHTAAKCCTGSWKRVTTGQQGWRYHILTLKTHHYEVWGANMKWKQAGLLWEANNSLSNFLVLCCQVFLTWPTPAPAPGKCPREAARQHQCSMWWGHLEHVLDLPPCCATSGKPCHHLAPLIKKVITRLKLLQAEIKSRLKKKKQTCPVPAVLAEVSLFPFWF